MAFMQCAWVLKEGSCQHRNDPQPGLQMLALLANLPDPQQPRGWVARSLAATWNRKGFYQYAACSVHRHTAAIRLTAANFRDPFRVSSRGCWHRSTLLDHLAARLQAPRAHRQPETATTFISAAWGCGCSEWMATIEMNRVDQATTWTMDQTYSQSQGKVRMDVHSKGASRIILQDFVNDEFWVISQPNSTYPNGAPPSLDVGSISSSGIILTGSGKIGFPPSHRSC